LFHEETGLLCQAALKSSFINMARYVPVDASIFAVTAISLMKGASRVTGFLEGRMN
jgi:hypothetical protein